VRWRLSGAPYPGCAPVFGPVSVPILGGTGIPVPGFVWNGPGEEGVLPHRLLGAHAPRDRSPSASARAGLYCGVFAWLAMLNSTAARARGSGVRAFRATCTNVLQFTSRRALT
jgi:hypothetical protein